MEKQHHPDTDELSLHDCFIKASAQATQLKNDLEGKKCPCLQSILDFVETTRILRSLVATLEDRKLNEVENELKAERTMQSQVLENKETGAEHDPLKTVQKWRNLDASEIDKGNAEVSNLLALDQYISYFSNEDSYKGFNFINNLAKKWGNAETAFVLSYLVVFPVINQNTFPCAFDKYAAENPRDPVVQESTKVLKQLFDAFFEALKQNGCIGVLKTRFPKTPSLTFSWFTEKAVKDLPKLYRRIVSDAPFGIPKFDTPCKSEDGTRDIGMPHMKFPLPRDKRGLFFSVGQANVQGDLFMTCLAIYLQGKDSFKCDFQKGLYWDGSSYHLYADICECGKCWFKLLSYPIRINVNETVNLMKLTLQEGKDKILLVKGKAGDDEELEEMFLNFLSDDMKDGKSVLLLRKSKFSVLLGDTWINLEDPQNQGILREANKAYQEKVNMEAIQSAEEAQKENQDLHTKIEELEQKLALSYLENKGLTMTCDQLSRDKDRIAKRCSATIDDNERLRTRLDTINTTAAPSLPPLPKTYDAMGNWVRAYYPGRLLLLKRGEREVKDGIYKDVPLVYKCLHLLATSYRDMKCGSVENNTFERELHKLGVECSPAIGEQGASIEDDTYYVTYPEGSKTKRMLEMHLCKGVDRDRRNCLRIYFFWDDDAKLVVIGSLPSHLVTQSS